MERERKLEDEDEKKHELELAKQKVEAKLQKRLGSGSSRIKRIGEFADRCLLTVVLCLLCEIRGMIYLDEIFGADEVESFWVLVDAEKQKLVLYGLIKLLSSRDLTSKIWEVVKKLITIDIKRSLTRTYPIPIYPLIKYLKTVEVEFHRSTKDLIGFDYGNRMKAMSLTKGIELIFELIEEGEEGITQGSWEILAYVVLNIDEELCPLLLPSVSQHMFDKYESRNLFPWLYSTIQGTSPKEEELDYAKIASEFSDYPSHIKVMTCSIFLCLLLRPSKGQQQHQIIHLIMMIVTAEGISSKIWCLRAQLSDRLLLIMEESKTNNTPNHVNSVIECVLYLLEHNVPVMGSRLDEFVDQVTCYFVDAPNQELQKLAGRCLARFLEWIFETNVHLLTRAQYDSLKSSINNGGFPKFNTEIQSSLETTKMWLKELIARSY